MLQSEDCRVPSDSSRLSKYDTLREILDTVLFPPSLVTRFAAYLRRTLCDSGGPPAPRFSAVGEGGRSRGLRCRGEAPCDFSWSSACCL